MFNILLFILTISLSMSSYAITRDYIPDEHPNDRYSVHDNGTVVDNITGLMWKRCSQGQTWRNHDCISSAGRHTWAGALEQAENEIYAGYEDWRLPNLRELKSIAAYNRFNPSINDDIFPNTPHVPFGEFWSSTPNVNNASSAWQLDFSSGSGYDEPREEGAYVRLVRLRQ